MIRVFNVAYGKAGGGLRAMAEAYERYLPSEEVKVVPIRLGGDSVPEGVIRVAASGHYDLRAMFCAWRLLLKHKPQVVICHCSRSLAIFGRVAKWLKVPTVGVTHSEKLKRFLCADYMIALSPLLKAKLIEMGYREDRILQAPNPVALPRGDFSPERSWNSNSAKDFRLGVLARLEKRKGADIAICAVDALQQEDRPTTLVIAGEGEERAALEQLVAARNLGKRVDFLGWVSDVDAFFSEIDLLLVPSEYETFGLTIVEAFARGIPVITARFRGFPEAYFIDRHNCIVAKAREPDAFAEAVAWCLDHHTEVEQMIQRAHRDFLDQFEAQVVANRIRGFLFEREVKSQ